MSKRPISKREKTMVEQMKQLGYRIRRPGIYKKITCYVHETTVSKFKDAAKEHGYRLQEAATEAFDQWIDAKNKKA